jgi:hypothetical protein
LALILGLAPQALCWRPLRGLFAQPLKLRLGCVDRHSAILPGATFAILRNFFFDTLLFCGAILLLANSIDKMKNKVGILLIANRKIAVLSPSDVTPWHKG